MTLLKFTHEEIVKRQADRMKAERLPFTVVLNDIRSLHNVGSIFRTCDAVGVEKLWLCGITGYPPAKPLVKTSLGAEDTVHWSYASCAVDVVKDLKKQGYQMVLLEQAQGSIPHDAFKPRAPVCLVVGNEVQGVDAQLLELCDAVVEIHMAGIKNSLNVAVAFGIMAYQIRTGLYLRNPSKLL